MKKRPTYDKALPSKMYSFFLGYEGVGAPSFSKFARSVRVTLSELEGFRKHKKFDEAYRECGEIRRDYLIDCALGKRFDSSFTKFLLGAEFSMGERTEEKGDDTLRVTLEVIE